MPQFKIRCSAISEIMGVKALGQTGKTYCDNWIKEQVYGRKKEFTSKYTEKGLMMEDEAIKFAASHFGWGEVVKNKTRYADDFMEGTPDIVLPSSIEDTKCSWDCFTFPLFLTEPPRDNMLQLQGYMTLTGRTISGLIYTLMDAPDSLVESEARKQAYKMGLDELPAELYDEIKATMTYSHLPVEQRIKRFPVVYDDLIVDQIRNRVLECRAYIASVAQHVLISEREGQR